MLDFSFIHCLNTLNNNRVVKWIVNVNRTYLFDHNSAPWVGNRTFLVEIVPPGLEIGHFLAELAPPGLGNLCQVLHSGLAIGIKFNNEATVT